MSINPNSGRRYAPEVKSFSFILHRRGVRSYVIARALGASTRSVCKWINDIRGSPLGLRAKRIRKNYPFDTYPTKVHNAFARLARWLVFRSKSGWMENLEKIASGVEPP